MRAAAVGLLLLLMSACGGGSDQPAAKPTPTATTQPAAAQPSTVTPTGEPAPEALSRFRCAPNTKGTWNSSGFLANGGKTPATYQVTVFVGEATGGNEQAKTTQVANIAAGGSVAFKITKVPAPDDGGTCHVQVLATK